MIAVCNYADVAMRKVMIVLFLDRHLDKNCALSVSQSVRLLSHRALRSSSHPGHHDDNRPAVIADGWLQTCGSADVCRLGIDKSSVEEVAEFLPAHIIGGN